MVSFPFTVGRYVAQLLQVYPSRTMRLLISRPLFCLPFVHSSELLPSHPALRKAFLMRSGFYFERLPAVTWASKLTHLCLFSIDLPDFSFLFGPIQSYWSRLARWLAGLLKGWTALVSWQVECSSMTVVSQFSRPFQRIMTWDARITVRMSSRFPLDS